MKLIVVSDLHGYLPELEDFDLLILPGDVCPVENHRLSFQAQWLQGEFADWINQLGYRDEHSRVVMCAGNHDFFFEGMSKEKKEEWLSHIKDNRLVYLDNEEYEFEYPTETGLEKIKIFGTPYCKEFGNWAFMRANLEKYYNVIPEGLDILFSHDAAQLADFGMIKEGWYEGTDAGNKLLADAILEKKPKYYFCGHIHSGNHELTKVGDGTIGANVSLMNENYHPVHDILIINEYGK